MSMSKDRRAKRNSAPEVTAINRHGIWLRFDGRDRFLRYVSFPWFRHVPRRKVRWVTRPFAEHLRWPALDVDLELDSIDHPERYPIVFGGPVGRPRRID